MRRMQFEKGGVLLIKYVRHMDYRSIPISLNLSG